MIEETPLAPIAKDPVTAAIIAGSVGRDRIRQLIISNKYTVLDDLVFRAVKKNAETIYKLDLDLFVELLNKFPKEIYNGIRAYIACYPDKPTTYERKFVPVGQEGQLTLLFVPTKANELYPDTGQDDITQFHLINSVGVLEQLPEPDKGDADKDIVTNWIYHYRTNRMLALEQDLQGAQPGFEETRSHWYDNDTIHGDGAEDDGLLACIDHLRRMPTNPVFELYVQFAAFRKEEDGPYPFNQLTMIYHLRQQNDPPPTIGGILATDDSKLIGSTRLTIRFLPADTGIPCPPATYCPGSGIAANLRQQFTS